MDEKRIYEDLIAGTPTKVCQLKELFGIGVVNAILSCAICLMLLVLICCFSMSKLSECSCICLLIVTIPIHKKSLFLCCKPNNWFIF